MDRDLPAGHDLLDLVLLLHAIGFCFPTSRTRNHSRVNDSDDGGCRVGLSGGSVPKGLQHRIGGHLWAAGVNSLLRIAHLAYGKRPRHDHP